MSDQMQDIKDALARDPGAQARPDARKAAVSAALKAFDEKNSQSRQGLSIPARLKGIGNTIVETLFRRRSMTFSQIKLPHMLAGGASLAVLTLAIVNTQQFAPKAPVVPEVTVTGPVDTKPEPKKSEVADGVTPKPAGKGRKETVSALNGAIAGAGGNKIVGGDVAASVPEAAEPAPRVAMAPMPAPPAGVAMKKSVRVGQLYANRAPVVKRRSGDQRQGGFKADGRDRFENIVSNPVHVVAEDPVSTFSVDVDTASYSFMRASLNRNVLPQKDAIRIEELINYFPYDYKAPDDKARPFRADVTVMPSPWNANAKLLHIGIKGYEVPKTARPHANLVFLLDTSGSMNAPNKLPLLRNSFKLLLSTLQPDDTVAIVTYAGSAGVVLEPTKVSEKAKILASLDRLSAGGSTAGAEGIRQAYQLAEQNFDKTGINRVILATDGDFNVGISNPEELKSFVERKRKTGVFLSVLGFGMGNYNDALMQKLAQNGNGNASYIDNLNEARKVLVSEAGSTLFTIAKDVKIQVEFNPAMVGEYRLIGYETRKLKREDFNNDKVDAGDIGSGHTVTAIYEFVPKGGKGLKVDPLRYSKKAGDGAAAKPAGTAGEYAFVKIRYKLPGGNKSTLITTPVTTANEVDSVAAAPVDTRFASAVAAYGQLLRGGKHTGGFTYDDVIKLALSAKGEDRFGYRAEFINLVRLAKSAAALNPLQK